MSGRVTTSRGEAYAAFAYALLGSLGLTTITDGAVAIMPTGTRSLSAYGMSLRIMLLVMRPAEPMRNWNAGGRMTR